MIHSGQENFEDFSSQDSTHTPVAHNIEGTSASSDNQDILDDYTSSCGQVRPVDDRIEGKKENSKGCTPKKQSLGEAEIVEFDKTY